MSSADEFLKVVGSADEKTRTGFFLSIAYYKEFKKICEKHNVTASELLDRLIKDFVDRQKERG